MTDSVESERVAIATEAGVPEDRARQIAACEAAREVARVLWQHWRCTCGAHEVT